MSCLVLGNVQSRNFQSSETGRPDAYAPEYPQSRALYNFPSYNEDAPQKKEEALDELSQASAFLRIILPQSSYHF